MAPAVLIQNLQKHYGSVEAQRRFQVEPGEIFGLLGPNGAGKTTTLRILCTLSTPDAGHVEVSGISVVDNPRADNGWAMWLRKLLLDKVLTGENCCNYKRHFITYPVPQREN